MDEARSVSARVTLALDERGRVVVVTDPPGLVPAGSDVETAMLTLGGALMNRLLSGPPRRPRFARPRRLARDGEPG